jgi:hypothetical protein
VQERFGQSGCPWSHEHASGRLVAHQERKGPHVVEVGVGHDDGIDAVGGQILEARNGSGAIFFGMHPGIEDDANLPYFEEIAVRSDLIGAVEKSKASVSHK